MPRKTKKPARSTQVAESALNSSQGLAEALVSILPEIKESMSVADIELALEDRGWLTSGRNNLGEISPLRRNEIIRESRIYWHRDPLGKQPVRLWSDYAIATGITFNVEDEEKDKDVQDKLEKFWRHRKNRCLTSSQGQWELSNQLLIDGDIFFAIFDPEEDDDVPIIRTVDPLQITRIISDPEDEREILVYKREWTPAGQTNPQTLYYRDWAATPEDVTGLKDPDTGKAFTVKDGVVIKQHPFEKFGQRGNGLLSCVTDWSRYHRQFMNARVSLTAALAKFAYKLTAKGSDKVVQAIKTKLGSTIPTDGLSSGIDKNPPTTAGGTWVQNQGLDIMPMPRATGGGDAKTDGDQLKLMVCAGTNVHQHYLGDPSTGNLATAEAMELPMLKSFTRYQESWKDCWRDIFSIVLQEKPEDEPKKIKIQVPPMLKDDLSRLGQFLMGLHQVFPEIQVPEILEMCLVALGAPNVEEIMESIREKQEQLAAQQKANQIAQGNQPAPTGPDGKSLAAGDSPLGPQLPQPSIKVTRFTPQASGSKESWLEVVRTVQQSNQIVPIIIQQESKGDNEALSAVLAVVKDFPEAIRQLGVLIAENGSSRRGADITRLLEKEDQAVAAINRLTEALAKESSPLLSEAQIEKLLPKTRSKKGQLFRDPSTGKMNFTVEEAEN